MHSAAGDEQGTTCSAEKRDSRVDRLRRGQLTGNIVNAFFEKVHWTIECLALHVFWKRDGHRAGFRRIGKHSHRLREGGENLFGPIDAIPVARYGFEPIVHTDALRSGVLELLEDRTGTAVGEDVAG